MLYAITIIVFGLNFFSKNKKINTFINGLLMWIIFGWSYGSYDTMIHIDRYCNPQKYRSWSEPLFNLLVYSFRGLGFSYRTFMVVISGIAILLMCFFVYSYSDYPGYVYNLYYLFPLGYSFSQLRYFLAYSIVLVAIDTLLKHRKHYDLLYIFLILAASCIHFSCFFFVIYLVVDKWKSLKKITELSIVLSVCVLLFFRMVLSFIGKISFLSQKLNYVIKAQVTKGNYKYVGMYVGLYLILIAVFFYKRSVEKQYITNEYEKLLVKINIVNIISIPLMLVFSTFFLRVIMYSQLLNYILFSNTVRLKNGKMTKQQLMLFFIVLFAICVLHKVMFWDARFNSLTIIPLFTENQLITG